jgi:SAM-dependent methyltransferase
VTLPRVGEQELAAFYPDAYGPYEQRMSPLEHLISRAIRAFQGWNALRTDPLVALRDRRPGRGLDVGCGRGDLAGALVDRGWAITGVEPSPSACAAAAGRGIDARCGTLSTVALEPESYDAAVFRHSLEHVGDPVHALRRVRAALVTGGLVLISVPNFGGWQARRFGGRWFHLDLPRHRVHFTRASLERALLEADLEPLASATSTTAVGLPASLQYRVFGRCLFPGGAGLRIASGACGGDQLHAIARRPA